MGNNRKKVVLAYSGGLDTSVAIKWIHEKYDMDVIALTIDLGTDKDLKPVIDKAIKTGAIKSMIIDAKEAFVDYYIFSCNPGRSSLREEISTSDSAWQTIDRQTTG